VSIHDPAWPEQRANIHRTLDAARARDAMGLFVGGWLLNAPAKPREARAKPAVST
jgi:hypothetical protein